MLSAADQLDAIISALVSSGGRPLSEPIIRVDGWSDLTGHLELDLVYPDGFRLYVTLTIDVRYGYPFWALYAFQFQNIHGRTIFRYDNWPNHPRVETFPHHKHVDADERIEPHGQPSLGAIIREVQGHVRSS